MRKTIATMLAGVLLATTFSARADGYGRRHDHRRDHYAPPRVQQHHHHRPRHDNNALAWGVAGLALGSVLFSIDTPRPPPVIVAPPARPPGRLWYYCESYRGYYPYVQYCPEGWRAVPASPY
jgi:hypothetical protein